MTRSTSVAAAFGVYAWTVFVLLALPTALLMVVLPGLRARRRLARAAAQCFFALCAIRVRLHDAGMLPSGPCVVVANHASYLDGIVLTAALPASFSFVIKQELRRLPLVHLLLRRIGSEFVERFDRRRGAADARRLLKAAANGNALAFFPEGTFVHPRGLGRFHSGAFVTAARTGLPVVPVLIRGARAVLPAGARLPRPGGRIDVRVCPPVHAESADGRAARRLRDDVRRGMLDELGEPDLAPAA
ncbi:MAG TPA: lysophospholipid acyltransferase family protein [Gammaproteobacteria bacterium]|nr:lysophospholipid acyltransferase family protein [Gammaproteobacteria bacterium]